MNLFWVQSYLDWVWEIPSIKSGVRYSEPAASGTQNSFRRPLPTFYERQIIGVAGVGSGAVQRELANLSSAGIVTRTKEGKQVYFQANVGSPVFPRLRAW